LANTTEQRLKQVRILRRAFVEQQALHRPLQKLAGDDQPHHSGGWVAAQPHAGDRPWRPRLPPHVYVQPSPLHGGIFVPPSAPRSEAQPPRDHVLEFKGRCAGNAACIPSPRSHAQARPCVPPHGGGLRLQRTLKFTAFATHRRERGWRCFDHKQVQERIELKHRNWWRHPRSVAGTQAGQGGHAAESGTYSTGQAACNAPCTSNRRTKQTDA
jgi:hypothetical protein